MSNNLKKAKAKNIFLSIGIISIVILVVFITGSIMFLKVQAENKELLNNTNMYNNVFIENMNVSNMSKDEAKDLLNNLTLDEKVTLTYKTKQYVYNKSDFGVTLNKDEAIEKAYNVGREGSEKERINIIKALEKNSQVIQIKKNIDEQITKAKLEEVAKNINIAPKNATLEKQGEQFVVKDGNNGITLDFEKTYENLYNALQADEDKIVEMTVIETEPQYKAQDLNKVQDNLGTFSTNFTNRGGMDNNRIINMKVAAERVNGTVLYPGEVFSTNKKFGATTQSNGYKPAPTIINGKFVDEYGGGVCQISSTLYNAVLHSELEIVERQNHSLKVGYLDYGYDATLAGDYIDFKFKNSTKYPIYVESFLTDNQVVCNIYGYDERPANRKIKFENALVESIEPGPKIIKETNELAEGQQKIEVKPLKGYKYKLYKLIYIDDKLQEKVLVNNSYYKPRAEEVLVGAKKTQPVVNVEKETISTTKQIKETQTNTTIQETETVQESITEVLQESTTENIELDLSN